MEEETYTLLKHVIGKDYASVTSLSSIEMKISKEATVEDMVHEFKRFMLAIGYSKKNLDEYIDDE